MILTVLLVSMVVAMNTGAESSDVAARTQQLTDKEMPARWYAAYALGQMGPAASPSVQPLVKTLMNLDEEEYVRSMAAWALGRIGSAAVSAVPSLQQALASELPSVRRNSARALGELGSASRPAVGRLIEVLGDPDPVVRVRAAEALWRIERQPRAVTTLVGLLRDADGSAAYEAATTLGNLEGVDETAIAPLIVALSHKDSDVSHAAARALGKFGARALPQLRKTLAASDADLAVQAVEAMDWIGPPAAETLVDALKHANPRVRRESARALGRKGPAARTAIPALVKLLNDPEPFVRDESARALDRIREKE